MNKSIVLCFVALSASTVVFAAPASDDAGNPMPPSGEHRDAKVQTATMEDSGPTMRMNPYFSPINYPLPQGTLMIMLLPDLQAARYTRNFVTNMIMVEYGLTTRWTTGIMAEGENALGQPATYGGLRFNAYFHVFPSDRLLNFTIYGEYEDLNAAALYKMEVAGFGGEDLDQHLDVARRTAVRTFEQRIILDHDWDRLNVTLNLVSETGLTESGNDFGYSAGIFKQPPWTGMTSMGSMSGMSGMTEATAPPSLSIRRLGFGLEAMGALGDANQFGFYWSREQHYAGPVTSSTLSANWTAHAAFALGLSVVSDPSVLQLGLGYSIDQLGRRAGTKPDIVFTPSMKSDRPDVVE